MNAAPSHLLVLGCHPAPDGADGGAALRLAAAAGNWDGALAKAEKEGVAPLLYWSLRDRPGTAPAAALDRLRLAFLKNLGRTTLVYREIEPFLAELRRSGLRAALTKGGRLALDAYPDPALRPFWDVDFIVHPDDWGGVRRILDGLGFVEAGETVPVNPVAVGASGPALDWTYSPYFRKGSIFLEFHAHPLGLHFPSPAEDGFWSSAGRLQVRGTEAMVLPAENELCYLCVHAQQHSYVRLIWLADIARLAGRPGLDWAWVCRIARDERIRGPVFYGLHLAESLWPGSVPAGPLAELRPGAIETAGLRRLWPVASVAARCQAEPWPYYMPSLFSLWERRDPVLAARTIGQIFFPPKAWLAAATGVPAGSPRLYGRYVERIFRPARMALRRILDTK
jgi:hypothetical protein